MTTLTHGHYAPLLHRSSAAPPSTLPQRRNPVFLRRDLRQRADYFANPTYGNYLLATLLGLPLPIALYCLFFDFLARLLQLG